MREAGGHARVIATPSLCVVPHCRYCYAPPLLHTMCAAKLRVHVRGSGAPRGGRDGAACPREERPVDGRREWESGLVTHSRAYGSRKKSIDGSRHLRERGVGGETPMDERDRDFRHRVCDFYLYIYLYAS